MFSDIIPESVIKQLSIRVKDIGGVNLGQGIPSFPTASHIIQAAKDSLNDPVIGVYPNFLGILELRQAIVGKLNKAYSQGLDAGKHILITVGAMEATAASIFSLVETGDRVGVLTPDYCNHFPQILLARGQPVEIPFTQQNQWVLNLKQIEKEAKKGLKLLILTNPNNPTGAVLTRRDLDLLVSLGKLYGFWILSDETYSFLSYDQPFVSILEYAQIYTRILCVRSFSKEYAMTGWRVGYVVGNEKITKGIAKVHDALTGCAPKISQRAALAAITSNQTYVQDYINVLRGRRDLVCKHLDDIPALTYAKPQGAYYVFPKYNKDTSSQHMSDLILDQARVAVVPGSVFGKAGEHHIRISFAVEDRVLIDGLGRLKQFFCA